MPNNLVKTKKQEGLWNRAKSRAAEEGHAEDWPYVVSIYKSMHGLDKRASLESRVVASAFGSELQKLAEKHRTPPTIEALPDALRMAKPGDIVVSTTSNTNPNAGIGSRIFTKVYRKAARSVMGDSAHASLYVGNGKIVGIAKGRGVKVHSVKNLVSEGRDLFIARPLVDKKTKGRALDYALSMKKARTQYDDSSGRFLKLWLRPYAKESVDAAKNEKLICSSLITRGYADVDFNRKKTPEMVNPRDFLRSSKVAPIATFLNPKREDVSTRVAPSKTWAA